MIEADRILKEKEEEAKKDVKLYEDNPIVGGIGLALTGLGMGLKHQGGEFMQMIEMKKAALQKKKDDAVDRAERERNRLQDLDEKRRDRAQAQANADRAYGLQMMKESIDIDAKYSDYLGKGNVAGAVNFFNSASKKLGLGETVGSFQSNNNTKVARFAKDIDGETVIKGINIGERYRYSEDKQAIEQLDPVNGWQLMNGVTVSDIRMFADSTTAGMSADKINTAQYVDAVRNGTFKGSLKEWNAFQTASGKTMEENKQFSNLDQDVSSIAGDVPLKDVSGKQREDIQKVYSREAANKSISLIDKEDQQVMSGMSKLANISDLLLKKNFTNVSGIADNWLSSIKEFTGLGQKIEESAGVKSLMEQLSRATARAQNGGGNLSNQDIDGALKQIGSLNDSDKAVAGSLAATLEVQIANAEEVRSHANTNKGYFDVTYGKTIDAMKLTVEALRSVEKGQRSTNPSRVVTKDEWSSKRKDSYNNIKSILDAKLNKQR